MGNVSFSSKVLSAFAFVTLALLVGHCSKDEKKKPGSSSKDACVANTGTATNTSATTGTVTSTGATTNTTTGTSTDTSTTLTLNGLALTGAVPSFSEVTSLLNEFYKKCQEHRPKPSKATAIDCSDHSAVTSDIDDILEAVSKVNPYPTDALATLYAWKDAGMPNGSGGGGGSTTDTGTTTYSSTSTDTSSTITPLSTLSPNSNSTLDSNCP